MSSGGQLYPMDSMVPIPATECANQKIFRIEFAARAKAAADFRLYKVNTALRQTDELGKNAPIGMRFTLALGMRRLSRIVCRDRVLQHSFRSSGKYIAGEIAEKPLSFRCSAPTFSSSWQ